jgi:hypothetical protein
MIGLYGELPMLGAVDQHTKLYPVWAAIIK